MVVRFVPIADIAGPWYVSLRRQVMPCISLWYNSCAIDTRERYIVKIVFEVNGKKVPDVYKRQVKAWRDIARLLSFPENIDKYFPENLSHSVMSSGLVLVQY